MLTAVLVVAACAEPYPVYYVNPAPPPLQPYMGPAIAAPAAVKRVVKRRYVRRHHRVRCRCTPAP
jgi:hypothetical protein